MKSMERRLRKLEETLLQQPKSIVCPFSVSLLPKMGWFSYEGARVQVQLSQAKAFEVILAHVVRGVVMEHGNVGYDVSGSSLYPGMTFQVKCSNPDDPAQYAQQVIFVEGVERDLNQAPAWWFGARDRIGADWYILFGLRENKVYPFAIPTGKWSRYKSDPQRIVTQEYSRCGSGHRRNQFWEYAIHQWPDGLYKRLDAKQLKLAI